MKQESKPNYSVYTSAFDRSKALVIGNEIVAKKKYGDPLVYFDKITKKTLIVFDESCVPTKEFDTETIYTIDLF